MSQDTIDAKVIEGVAADGWFGLHVASDEQGPGFSYSVGFWESVKAPEFIIFGLPHDVCHSILWSMYRQVREGLKPRDGLRVKGLIGGFDCVLRPVHASQRREYFGYALWYQRQRLGNDVGLAAYQIFWPGKVQGLFPWEAGCDALVREDQPLLYLPDETGLA